MTDERLRAEQLREIISVSTLITSTLDELEIRRRAVEAATRLVDAERASLLLIEGRGNRLYFEVALGEDPHQLNRVRLLPGQGIAGSVVQTCSAEIINDVASDERYRRDFDARTGFETKSMICAPLTCKDAPLGVLEVINKRSGAFDEDDLAVVTALANQIAIAIENARLHRRLRRSFVEVSVYAALFSAAFIWFGLWLVSLGR
jgi:sigma-B regulation protein RsbU (phosphoserine phosphatase)